MAKNIDFMGAIFPDVPSIRLPQQGGGLVSFDDTTDADATASDIAQGKTAYVNGEKITGTASGGSATIEALSVTANGTYTAPSGVDGYSPITVNVSGGGGGIGTLLATQSLGTISTTSTSAVDTNKTVSVSNAGDYDLLIVETSADTNVSDKHLMATVGLIFLYGSSSISSKTSASIATSKWNCQKSGTVGASSRASSTSYGIYPNSCSISDKTATIPLYMKYNSTHTGTINSNYTTRVYGVKLYDLIGG